MSVLRRRTGVAGDRRTLLARACRASVTAACVALLAATAGAGAARAQAGVTTLDLPQGGRIVYGHVAGADSQGEAMMTILRSLHQNFGDKPRIGKVFEMRGTDSVAVFFSVTNRPAGNVPVAGMIIAANSRPHEAQAGLIWDRADRLSESFNPMLQKLFSVWHPATTSGTAGSSDRGPPAAPQRDPASSGRPDPVGPLHPVQSADRTTTAMLPEGWVMDPRSAGGTLLVSGPHGESISNGMKLFAVDPTHPERRGQVRSPGMLYYPFRGDLVRAYPDMVQAWRQAVGRPPLKLEVAEIEPRPMPNGVACVIAKGRMDPFGTGMLSYVDFMCAQKPGGYGVYLVQLSRTLVPIALRDRDSEMVKAINGSWKIDQALLMQMDALAARQAAATTQQMIAVNQQRARAIQQFGEATVARNRDIQRQYDQQHADFNAGQVDVSRRAQGFSNYLLDQTVIRDLQNTNDHATVWNRTADALIRAYPDRVQEVPTSRYINGKDF